jgi:dTDP-4-dehydrorhamnose 3,5-epimerase
VIFVPTALQGAFIIQPEKKEDERGFFARTWCQHEFEEHGLNSRLVQCNVSFNKTIGTLRGLHLQAQPHEQAKLVRCTLGAIYDVIVDIRPNSPTFKHWFAVKLNSADHKMVYIPEGMAHGFQSLSDNSEVFYQMSEFYHPETEKGLRYDDPAIGITWPLPVSKISSRDLTWPLLEEFAFSE